MGGTALGLDIQDTGGSYVDEFPAMLACSLASADAVLLVYSVSDLATFEEVSRLRDLVHQQRGEELPLVVVGNKTDLARQIPREEAEATVLCDWENGYVECCAKDNLNIPAIFRALLVQAKSPLLLLPSIKAAAPTLRRRQSMPQIPAFLHPSSSSTSSSSPLSSFSASTSTSPMSKKRRRSLLPQARLDSCTTQ